ncbi:MAG TPA: Ig-like domain-containing protein, partial [Acidimicrobiales bacterium]|nr:Ig-like domain-containing protein [Acidimicrobiales bacterium]
MVSSAAAAAGSKHNGGAVLPVVTIASPSGSSTVSGTVTLSGSASGKYAIASVQTAVDGAAWQTVRGTSNWNSSWNTTALSNGSHTLSARATDTAGNVSSAKSESVSVNNVSPIPPPTVSISTPANGSTISGVVAVSGSASSSNSAVASVETSVDGGAWKTVSGTTSWSWSWDTTGLSNGTHTLSAQATDSAGDVSAVVGESVNVSNAIPPPMASISSPANGSTVSGVLSVTGSASSSSSTVASVEISVDGVAWQTVSGTTSWSWSWDTTGLSNGTHTLSAEATDTAGNESVVATDSVNVSNTATVTTPPDTQGSWVSPEGVHIIVNSAGSWTISQIYSILKANALELSIIGPDLTIDVQDQYASVTTTSAAQTSGGSYYN